MKALTKQATKRATKQTTERGIGQIGGEFALIERIADLVNAYREDLLVGIGDDAAVLRLGKSKRVTVVTTDMLLENVHFRLAWADPYRLGWKAVAVNLSDVAAMGARPTWTFSSIALAPDTPVPFVDELYRGMRDAAARYGSLVVGGDTNVSPSGPLVINITQLGVAARKKRLALRSRALPGDVLIVTGAGLGNAAAGLALLEAQGRTCAEQICPEAVAAQLQPRPRVAEARAAVRTGAVSAMMDLSDGLVGDLGKLCRASQVGARVWRGDVPVGEAAGHAADFLAADAQAWALGGGEDYELLLAVRPESADDVCVAIGEAAGTPATIIGEITGGSGVVLADENGHEQIAAPGRGWDHFGDSDDGSNGAAP